MGREAGTARTSEWYTGVVMRGSLLLAVCLFVLGKWFGTQRETVQSPAYDPPFPVDVARLHAMDMRAIHADLIPAWIVDNSDGGGDASFAALQAGVQADPNLLQLLGIMRDASVDEPEVDRLLWAAWAWNEYLDDNDLSWRVGAGFHTADGRTAFYLKTYRAIADGEASVDDQTFRLRVLRRADDLGVYEAYLGHTPAGEDGSLVVADRVASFALDEVWPLMDPDLDDRHAAPGGHFGTAVRAAVAPALTDDQREALILTASDRFYIQEAVAGIHERHRCGSRLLIREIPFGGLSGRDLRRIRRAMDLTETRPCPEATLQESLVLSVRSEHLQSVGSLESALERLAALTARAIAIHEIRHAADSANGSFSCRGCPEDLPDVGVLELSAYLASFTDSDVGVLAALQACTLPLDELPARGPAIRFLSESLGGLCRTGPPPDLAGRAMALERRLFGRSGAVVLSADFPDRIGVTTRDRTDGWSHSLGQ